MKAMYKTRYFEYDGKWSMEPTYYYGTYYKYDRYWVWDDGSGETYAQATDSEEPCVSATAGKWVPRNCGDKRTAVCVKRKLFLPIVTIHTIQLTYIICRTKAAKNRSVGPPITHRKLVSLIGRLLGIGRYIIGDIGDCHMRMPRPNVLLKERAWLVRILSIR